MRGAVASCWTDCRGDGGLFGVLRRRHARQGALAEADSSGTEGQDGADGR